MCTRSPRELAVSRVGSLESQLGSSTGFARGWSLCELAADWVMLMNQASIQAAPVIMRAPLGRGKKRSPGIIPCLAAVYFLSYVAQRALLFFMLGDLVDMTGIMDQMNSIGGSQLSAF
uniref:Uncharacterized protein n=1 Tax=Coccidioides posadasii RMSCC 3488 TaxID=454284 RepID=A0A0J6FD28_COCPO|nr:hypothetical protein CPAG_03117 [Coccidioides posadasii RMSCC 3488]